jgi:hypothetical protein
MKFGGECSEKEGGRENGAMGKNVRASNDMWWSAVVVWWLFDGGGGVCESWRVDRVKGDCVGQVKEMGEGKGIVT